jgi:hypothetical protein
MRAGKQTISDYWAVLVRLMRANMKGDLRPERQFRPGSSLSDVF